MPTGTQDKNFAEEMAASVDDTIVKMSNSTLDNAIAWIQDNLDPDDVFKEKQLESWAESNGYVKE
jgi:hypothetical protein